MFFRSRSCFVWARCQPLLVRGVEYETVEGWSLLSARAAWAGSARVPQRVQTNEPTSSWTSWAAPHSRQIILAKRVRGRRCQSHEHVGTWFERPRKVCSCSSSESATSNSRPHKILFNANFPSRVSMQKNLYSALKFVPAGHFIPRCVQGLSLGIPRSVLPPPQGRSPVLARAWCPELISAPSDITPFK